MTGQSGGGGGTIGTNASRFSAVLTQSPAHPVNLTDPGQWRLARFWDTAATDTLAYQETVFMAQYAYLNGNVEVANNLTVDQALAAANSVTAGVVVLTYAATLTVNAAAGNHFRVTLIGNAIVAAPASPTDGQKITFEVIQDGAGSRLLTWAGGYSFGSGSAPTLTTTPNKRDLIGFCYSASLGSWMYAGITQAF